MYICIYLKLAKRMDHFLFNLNFSIFLKNPQQSLIYLFRYATINMYNYTLISMCGLKMNSNSDDIKRSNYNGRKEQRQYRI